MEERKTEKPWVDRINESDLELSTEISLIQSGKNLAQRWKDFSNEEARIDNFTALETIFNLLKDTISDKNRENIFHLAKSFYQRMDHDLNTDKTLLSPAQKIFWDTVFSALPQKKVSDQEIDESVNIVSDQEIDESINIYVSMIQLLGTFLKTVPIQKAKFLEMVDTFKQNNAEVNFERLDNALSDCSLLATSDSENKKEVPSDFLTEQTQGRSIWKSGAAVQSFEGLREIFDAKAENQDLESYQQILREKYHKAFGFYLGMKADIDPSQFSRVAFQSVDADTQILKDADNADESDIQNIDQFWEFMYETLPQSKIGNSEELEKAYAKYQIFIEIFDKELGNNEKNYQKFISSAQDFLDKNVTTESSSIEKAQALSDSLQALKKRSQHFPKTSSDVTSAAYELEANQSGREFSLRKSIKPVFNFLKFLILLPVTLGKWVLEKPIVGFFSLFTQDKNVINFFPVTGLLILLFNSDKLIDDYPNVPEWMIRSANILAWVALGFALPYLFVGIGGFVFTLNALPAVFMGLETIAIAGFTTGAQVFTMITAAVYALICNVIQWQDNRYYSHDFQETARDSDGNTSSRLTLDGGDEDKRRSFNLYLSENLGLTRESEEDVTVDLEAIGRNSAQGSDRSGYDPGFHQTSGRPSGNPTGETQDQRVDIRTFSQSGNN